MLSRFYKLAALSWFGTTFLVGLPISRGNRYTGVISVSRFAVRFRPGPDFDRSILIGLPFSGFDRSAGGFSSTEAGIFDTTDVISVCNHCADRSTGGFGSTETEIFGIPVGVPVCRFWSGMLSRAFFQCGFLGWFWSLLCFNP